MTLGSSVIWDTFLSLFLSQFLHLLSKANSVRFIEQLLNEQSRIK